ncbi:MAG: hypothetical protein RR218_08205, partial [Gordonibacter sp.]
QIYHRLHDKHSLLQLTATRETSTAKFPKFQRQKKRAKTEEKVERVREKSLHQIPCSAAFVRQQHERLRPVLRWYVPITVVINPKP